MFQPETSRLHMKLNTHKESDRSQGLRGLRRKPADTSLLGLRVRIPSGGGEWMFLMNVVRWAGREFCDGPIPRPGGFYLAYVALVVIWCNNYPPHLQWVGRRGQTKRKEKKVIRMYFRCHPGCKSSSLTQTLPQLLPRVIIKIFCTLYLVGLHKRTQY